MRKEPVEMKDYMCDDVEYVREHFTPEGFELYKKYYYKWHGIKIE